MGVVMPRILTPFLLLAVVLVMPANATTTLDKRLGGRVQARVDGETVFFPTLKTDIKADIQGDLATVSVTQNFVNPLTTTIHASYLFPLNKDAAVYEMIMQVGDETVHADIQRIEQARATFNTAKREGRSASLLTQQRPNMFTQDIANLMPGLPIKVTLRYVQTLAKVDGAYEMVIPLVVGPRFQPTHTGAPPDAEEIIEAQVGVDPTSTADYIIGGVPRWKDGAYSLASTVNSHASFGRWELETLPAYPPVAGLDIPAQIEPDRVAIEITMNGSMPIRQVESATHKLDVQALSVERRSITLAKGRIIDNRDFALRYGLAGDASQAGLLSYKDERGGFFSLLIEPPATPAVSDITPREMVFVLDCSGSMSGLPLQASKAFMRQALRKLRPNDTFRIIRFSDAATEFSATPLPATPGYIRQGIRYTDSLRGSGGTMMTSGILQALQAPVPPGSIRLVTFLTDGYIGNESEVLGLIHKHIGSARLFAFGVGAGVNRFLMSEMGRVGRGFTRYMDPTEDVQEVAVELAERLQSPVLIDIRIDWGKLRPTDMTPTLIPDLFAGQSLRVQGRYAKPGDYEIKVHGLVNGREAVLPLKVKLPKQSDHGDAVALVWARSAIKDSMRLLSTPILLREGSVPDYLLKQHVTKLGLDFSLVTRWTAFVAVTNKIYNNNPAQTPTRPVPLAQVKGVSHLAYGNTTASSQSQPSQFTGFATPEPATIFGLALIGLLFAWFAMRLRPARTS